MGRRPSWGARHPHVAAVSACRAWLGIMGLLLPGPARAEQLPVTFPQGWTVLELPGPTVDGHVTPGDRRRAFLPGPDGKPLAAIELTEIPGGEAQRQPLADIVQIAQDTTAADYAKAGLQDRCAAPAPVRAGTWSALQIDCTVSRREEPVLHQVIAMWATPGGFYSLSYTAPTRSGQAGQAEFGQVLGSIGTR